MTLHTLSNRLLAAAGSIFVSTLVFATAIAPANQGVLLPGVFA